ncbi:MAG: hypothetical protein JO290_03325 [Sphingomonadaceae bacterium]|nr:hypothetical protein [Sphingomonadaceae bacterium]
MPATLEIVTDRRRGASRRITDTPADRAALRAAIDGTLYQRLIHARDSGVTIRPEVHLALLRADAERRRRRAAHERMLGMLFVAATAALPLTIVAAMVAGSW